MPVEINANVHLCTILYITFMHTQCVSYFISFNDGKDDKEYEPK